MSDAIDRDAAILELEKAIYRSMPTRIVIGGAAIDCPTPEGADEMQRRIAGWFRDALRSLPAVPSSRITRAEADARLDATLRKMAESDHAPRVACPKCYAEFPASAAERLARAAEAYLAKPSSGRALADLVVALAEFRAAPPAAEPASSPALAALESVIARSHKPERFDAKEPAPCGTCGGSGQVGSPCPDGPKFVGGVLVSCAVMHSRPCPSCRPGGEA